MVKQTTIDTHYGDEELDEKPHDDVDSLSLAEEFLSVLDAQQGLCDHDDSVHPALRAHTLAARVCHVDVILPKDRMSYVPSLLKTTGKFSVLLSVI